MKRATVLIPTQKRVASLSLAVQSAREQTLQDFELFIVGDGVSDATRDLVRELCVADDRIRFFDFDKAPGQGELNCHRALQVARGRLVAYLGDDDCWMPDHLAVLDELLEEAFSVTRCRWASDPTGSRRLAADLRIPPSPAHLTLFIARLPSRGTRGGLAGFHRLGPTRSSFTGTIYNVAEFWPSGCR